MVWVRCPKHKHHGFKAVRCAVASAVSHFHQGAKSRIRIMERLSAPAGACSSHAFELKDRKRLNKADKQASTKERNADRLYSSNEHDGKKHFVRVRGSPMRVETSMIWKVRYQDVS